MLYMGETKKVTEYKNKLSSNLKDILKCFDNITYFTRKELLDELKTITERKDNIIIIDYTKFHRFMSKYNR